MRVYRRRGLAAKDERQDDLAGRARSPAARQHKHAPAELLAAKRVLVINDNTAHRIDAAPKAQGGVRVQQASCAVTSDQWTAMKGDVVPHKQ